MRRWTVLPILVASVPWLIKNHGGDALSICFNTVALLFICDIDNIAFKFGLSERMRARVEEAGRVDLSDVEAFFLARTKIVHVLLITVCLLAIIVGHMYELLQLEGTTLLVFWVGGIIEAVQTTEWREMCKQIFASTAASVAGLCFWAVLFMLA